MAAATKDADRKTVRSRDLRLAMVAEWSQARWYESAVFFMFHRRPAGNERCGSNNFPYYSKACAIQPGGSNPRDEGSGKLYLSLG
jgi:hypothetical protein